jgi:pyruvate/2-oxoglutarate/acetoin dehydrogenase E1 component
MSEKITYSQGILSAFEYLLENHDDVFVIGQGLWSPWYVGNTMKDLDKIYGKERIIDTPLSESAVTGMAVGASLGKSLPIVVHPRIDFMLYAMDAIVNQAAKWSHMTGGQANPALTIRGIINRGGEQGAQHSQSLHSWFAHIPGLRVLMPATPIDARDMLISATLSKDPVIYIDDRWLYEVEELSTPIEVLDIQNFRPKVLVEGDDLTIAASGFSVQLALNVASLCKDKGTSIEVIDIRALNPFDPDPIVKSVEKTKRILAIDGGWSNCGFSSEIISSVVENIAIGTLLAQPKKITIEASPAPTSRVLEDIYYPSEEKILSLVEEILS